jgi:hypothetical protein
MGKTKQWLCIAALTLALAPAAWADEPNALAIFFDDLIAQIVAQVTGSTASEIGIQIPGGGAPAELGIQIPGGGTPADQIGVQVPVSGDAINAGPGEPGGQSELGIQIPGGG